MLFYLTMLGSIAVIGYFVHWMSATYGAASTLTKGVVIAGLTCTPLFIAGLVGLIVVTCGPSVETTLTPKNIRTASL